MISIEKASVADFDEIWPIFSDIVKSGDTYVYSPEIAYEDAKTVWFGEGFETYKAVLDGKIIGAYVIRPAHRDLGSHTANAAYIIAREYRGNGYGKLLGEHSLEEAKKLDYKGLQFNYVISINETAISLWKSLGFEIIGTVPEAHNHPNNGLVDIHIMYKKLG